jgi:hypothetical protein
MEGYTMNVKLKETGKTWRDAEIQKIFDNAESKEALRREIKELHARSLKKTNTANEHHFFAQVYTNLFDTFREINLRNFDVDESYYTVQENIKKNLKDLIKREEEQVNYYDKV